MPSKCLNGQCQIKGVVYQATVTRHDNNKEETYIGLTENTFKIRYNQHTHSFRHDQNRNQTALSKYIWTLKDKNIDYTIEWGIVARGRAYTALHQILQTMYKRKVLHHLQTPDGNPKYSKWTGIRVQAQKETPPVQCIIVKFYCIYKSQNIILCLINCLCVINCLFIAT